MGVPEKNYESGIKVRIRNFLALLSLCLQQRQLDSAVQLTRGCQHPYTPRISYEEHHSIFQHLTIPRTKSLAFQERAQCAEKVLSIRGHQ